MRKSSSTCLIGTVDEQLEVPALAAVGVVEGERGQAGGASGERKCDLVAGGVLVVDVAVATVTAVRVAAASVDRPFSS